MRRRGEAGDKGGKKGEVKKSAREGVGRREKGEGGEGKEGERYPVTTPGLFSPKTCAPPSPSPRWTGLSNPPREFECLFEAHKFPNKWEHSTVLLFYGPLCFDREEEKKWRE